MGSFPTRRTTPRTFGLQGRSENELELLNLLLANWFKLENGLLVASLGPKSFGLKTQPN
jgi:hypothetical protein